jgi:putative NADPH-quinone reductase
MAKQRITVIQGHPDAGAGHYCHALAEAYARGAREGGHKVRVLDVARMDFPLLRSKAEWESALFADSVREAQDAIRWSTHLVLIYPLWLGTMPALLKAFLEQVLRPGFAVRVDSEARSGWKKLLAGRSAHIVVTMGMPALVYRWFFRAHSLKSLERNILGFCGIGPIRESLVGAVESSGAALQRWLTKMRSLGRQAA